MLETRIQSYKRFSLSQRKIRTSTGTPYSGVSLFGFKPLFTGFFQVFEALLNDPTIDFPCLSPGENGVTWTTND